MKTRQDTWGAPPDKPRTPLLVVEDEAIVALDLEQQLEEMGYQVVGVAESGAEAIQMARRFRPRLALMDVVLKGALDGIETAALMAGLDVPIVFLTSFSDSETVDRAARMGPLGYLTKPFQSKELKATIEVALAKAAMEQKLRESEQWFSSTLRCVADGVVLTEPDHRIRFLNPAAVELTGWTPREAMGRSLGDVVRYLDIEFPNQAWPRASALTIDAKPRPRELCYSLQRRDGVVIPVEVSMSPVLDESERPLGTVTVLRDITERLRAEQKLRESEARFHNAFEFAPVGMALVGLDGRFLQVNGALCKMLGTAPAQLISRPHADSIDPADCGTEQAHLDLLMAEGRPSVQFELHYPHRDGQQVIWALVSVSLLRAENDAESCHLYQIQDVTERKQAEVRLVRLAHLDPLTGLANRTSLNQAIEQLILDSRHCGKTFAVVYLDLDQFKPVNDRLGHEAGDFVLRETAARLKALMRETDCVARVGGDEFVMLLPDVGRPERVATTLMKVQHALEQTMTYRAQAIAVTSSAGVSLFPVDGDDASTLIRRADRALYASKSRGRNCFTLYSDALGSTSSPGGNPDSVSGKGDQHRLSGR